MTSHRHQPQRTPHGTHPHLQSLRAGLHYDSLYILGSTFVGVTLIGLALHRYTVEPQQFDTTTDVGVHVAIGVVVIIFAIERYFRNLDTWHDHLIDVEQRHPVLDRTDHRDAYYHGVIDYNDRLDHCNVICADCGDLIVPGEPVVSASVTDEPGSYFHSRCFARVHRAE